jgi:hypothetical protein
MNKIDEQGDQRMAQEAKKVFDESVDGLDAATLSRLNRGRQAALSQAARRGKEWRRWTPAAGVAAAVLLAVITLRGPGEVDVITAPASDLEILLGEESIEMFEELEFYSWLETQELDGDGDFG